MNLSPQLKAKLSQAVQTSMRIEGYKPAAVQPQQAARKLMEEKRVQVSIPAK